jgi:hypothetical protein
MTAKSSLTQIAGGVQGMANWVTEAKTVFETLQSGEKVIPEVFKRLIEDAALYV